MRVKLRRSPGVLVVHQSDMSLLKGGGQALMMACRRCSVAVHSVTAVMGSRGCFSRHLGQRYLLRM